MGHGYQFLFILSYKWPHNTRLPAFRRIHPQSLDMPAPAIAFFKFWNGQLAITGQVEIKGLEITTQIIHINYFAVRIVGQAKVFGEGAGVVQRGIQEGKDINDDALLCQLLRKSANIDTTFPAGISPVTDEENSFSALGRIAKKSRTFQQACQEGGGTIGNQKAQVRV